MGKKLKKMTNEILQHKLNYNFSRDAEWYKRTREKIDKVKEDLNNKFYTEDRKKQKVDFIRKLKVKLKDYSDAIKFQARYKKIRFVERRKIERKLNKINKEITEEKDKEALKAKEELKNDIVKDLNYVKYYPTTYKYYSLFPLHDKDKKEMLEKRAKMRKKIEFYVNRKHNKEKEIYEEEEEKELKQDEDGEGKSNKDIEMSIYKEKEENNNVNDNDNDNADKEEQIDHKKVKSKYKKKTEEENDINVDDNNEEEEETKVKLNVSKGKNKKKDKHQKEKEHNDIDYDYEGIRHKKKKPFKDDFFVIDDEDEDNEDNNN